METLLDSLIFSLATEFLLSWNLFVLADTLVPFLADVILEFLDGEFFLFGEFWLLGGSSLVLVLNILGFFFFPEIGGLFF